MSEEDDELEIIKQRRLQQLREQSIDAQRQEAIAREIEAQRQAVLRTILTDEARQRLTNIKMVKQDLATNLENQLIQLSQTRRLTQPITDAQLRNMLQQLQSRGQREARIIRR
jgi:programmed cell death protein 5